MIPPTRGRTGGEAFLTDFGLVLAALVLAHSERTLSPCLDGGSR
jgi:hypothetical protein